MIKKLFVLLLAVTVISSQNPWDRVQQVIDDFYVNDIVLSVSRSSGREYLYEKSSRLTMQTKHSIWSASKWVSGTMIMKRAVEEQGWDLDEPICNLIDWWTCDPSDLRSKMTLRACLSFTTGYQSNDICPNRFSRTFADCSKSIYDTYYPAYEPVTQWEYNEQHLNLGGLVVEALTGKTIPVLLREFLDEMGMYNSDYLNGSYEIYMGGSLQSSGDDYEKFLKGQFEKTNMSPELIDAMEGTYPEGVVPTPGAWAGAEKSGPYGLANWWDCPYNEDPNNLPQKCLDENLRSSTGMAGYLPLIDRTRGYYMHLIINKTYGYLDVFNLRVLVKDLIDAAMEDRNVSDERYQEILDELAAYNLENQNRELNE